MEWMQITSLYIRKQAYITATYIDQKLMKPRIYIFWRLPDDVSLVKVFWTGKNLKKVIKGGERKDRILQKSSMMKSGVTSDDDNYISNAACKVCSHEGFVEGNSMSN